MSSVSSASPGLLRRPEADRHVRVLDTSGVLLRVYSWTPVGTSNHTDPDVNDVARVRGGTRYLRTRLGAGARAGGAAGPDESSRPTKYPYGLGSTPADRGRS